MSLPCRGKLAPYKPFIRQRFFQEKCRNSLQILREMQQQSYTGSSTIVVNYVTQLCQLLGEPSTAGPVMRTRPTPLTAELRGFARGLGRDEVAIRAGLDLPWSQGQIEGQITRLKLIKR